jgi:alkylation response protein AidB-like acyl-CoA dehydrogenase
MDLIEAPPRDELMRRAPELIPLLRDKAIWMDENRRLQAEVTEALTAAGFLKMRVPVRYGGQILCGPDSNTPYL